jgi:hypothetical protein
MALSPGRRRPVVADAAAPETPVAPGRALIAVEAPARDERAAFTARRPLANFVAQLIATRDGAAQTRLKRKVDPEEAAAVYGGVMKGPSTEQKLLLRSV